MSQQEEFSPIASAGRPRSVKSQQAILAAAWTLLQQKPVRKVSIESIACEAGVGKSTIYRWWSSKTAVIIDAFLEQDKTTLPFPETQTIAESFAAQMSQLVRFFIGDVGRVVAEIIAEGQSDPSALESFRDRFLTPRRDAAKEMIVRGIEIGEFDADLDPDLAMDILYGPIYYRLLVQHLPLNEAFVSALSRRATTCLVATLK